MVMIADGRNEGKRNGEEERGAFQTKLDLAERIFHAPTTRRGRHLLHVLVHHFNVRTKQCNPSQALLAQEMGCSERNVRDILKKDLANLVTVRRTQKSLYYTLHLPENAPAMMVASTADGQFPVAQAGFRPEADCRSDRKQTAGRTGSRLPQNREGTRKERFSGQQQKTPKAKPKKAKPKKAKPDTPSLEAVLAAFAERGFSPDKASQEAARFLAYNTAKGWKGDWQANVERWQAQESDKQAAEFKPSYHRAYEPSEIERHTPEQQAANLSVLRNLRIKAARKEKRG